MSAREFADTLSAASEGEKKATGPASVKVRSR
jgi:hypothetical protein